MPITLTPGRYRGLKSTSLAQADVFGIIAFDQRGSYRQMMPAGASYETLVQVKGEIINALSKEASAILTDPTYGLKAAMEMSPKAGLLLALEKSGYSGDSSYRKTELIRQLDAGEESARPAPARSSSWSITIPTAARSLTN